MVVPRRSTAAARAALWATMAGVGALPVARPATGQEVPADVAAALGRISADSLKGHVAFLASDLLEGRNTPSRGLDLAAEYLAAQFRRAGLEPIGDDGYFQTARWRVATVPPEGFSLELSLDGGDKRLRLGPERVSLTPGGKVDLDGVATVKVSSRPEELKELRREDVADRAVVLDLPTPKATGPEARREAAMAREAIVGHLAPHRPALIVFLDRAAPLGAGLGGGRLIDPEGPSRFNLGNLRTSAPQSIIVHDPDAVAALDKLGADGPKVTVAFHLAAPEERPAVLRNVVGLLRGSDPTLKGTYVLVTAHYDHLGLGPPVAGDRVFNGANDDASGTASVVEIASALATLKARPKRSVVFLAFFGEEKGLLGSRFYARHPVVPLAATVADINLEQVGRTDDSEGPRVAAANLTGFDYSTVADTLRAAGEATGVRLEKHPRNSDRFFGASDNAALADAGIPAHTVSVSYVFPDYHGLGDSWEKLDYANMAKVDRMVALGVYRLADSPEAPRWDETNPNARRYAARRGARPAGL